MFASWRGYFYFPALALAPNFYLPALAPNLYLPTLAPNLYLPALTQISVYTKFVFTDSARPQFAYTVLVSANLYLLALAYDLYVHRLLSWFTHNDAE